MKHRFDKTFFAAQSAVAEKAKAEAAGKKGKTWKSLKNDEKDKIAYVAAQKIGSLPENMPYE